MDELNARIGYPLELVVPHLEIDPLGDHILVSGSIVEGLGNCLSDIDLFILTRSARPTARKFFFWSPASRWVDVECLTYANLRHLVGRFRRVSPEFGGWVGHPSPSLADQDLYHRLSIALKLANPLSRMRLPRFDRASLQEEVAYTEISAARSRWVDAVGAARSGQIGQAMFVGQLCLDHIIDGYCALLGETNPSVKWRKAKLLSVLHGGRDELEIFRFFNWYNELKELTPSTVFLRISGVALLLFFVMQRFFCVRTFTIPRTCPAYSRRLEYTPQAVYSVDSEGRIELAAKAEMTQRGDPAAALRALLQYRD